MPSHPSGFPGQCPLCQGQEASFHFELTFPSSPQGLTSFQRPRREA